MSVPEIKKKIGNTYLEHYGMSNVFAFKEIQRQLYDAMMDKYGAGYTQQIPEIREKTEPSLVWSKYGKNRKIPESSLVRLGADRLLDTDCEIDNHQIMVHEGWLLVYTAGNKVYVYEEE